jgi:hypothetical protein
MSADRDNALWWFDAPELEGERHRHLLPLIKDLDEQQYLSRQEDLRHGQAYDQKCQLMGSEMELRGAMPDQTPPIENVVRSGIDTMTAHISRDRPRLAVLTDDADFILQLNARGMEKALEAEIRRLKVYSARTWQIRGAGVYGSGFLKIYEQDNKPCIDRVLKDEMVWDEEEARLYPPRSMYQRRFVDRWVLLHQLKSFNLTGEQHQKAAEAIAKAGTDWCSYRRLRRHQVAIIEGVRLPSGPGAKDGRRTVSVQGADLVDVEWKRDYYPWLKWDWSERVGGGYVGSGIGEQGRPVQNRINRHDRFICVAQDKVAIPRVYVQKGAGVRTHLDNRVGAIVEVQGRPPTFETPQAVSEEIYRDRDRKRDQFYEGLGISRLAARAEKPVGVESEPGLREYRSQAMERWAIQDQSAEDLLIEIGERVTDIIEDIVERTGTYKTTYLSQDTREEIDWKEVRIARDRYSLTVVAANGLTRTVAGRRQEVEEDFANGVITMEQYRKLRGYPDTNAARSIEGAMMTLTDATIAGLMRKNVPFSQIAPDEFDDLKYILRWVELKRAHLKAHNAPDWMLDRFDKWIAQAKHLTGQVIQPPAPAPTPGGVPPEVLMGAAPGPAMVPNGGPAMPPGMPMPPM